MKYDRDKTNAHKLVGSVVVSVTAAPPVQDDGLSSAR